MNMDLKPAFRKLSFWLEKRKKNEQGEEELGPETMMLLSTPVAHIKARLNFRFWFLAFR